MRFLADECCDFAAVRVLRAHGHEGSGRDFWQHPVGTGGFRFMSQQIDQDVVVERNPQSWAAAPKIERVRFAVVPDAITRSLELEKGSGDVAVNSLPMDSLPVL